MVINTHILGRVWREGQNVRFEVDSLTLFEPGFTRSLEPASRPIEDWWYESMEMDLSDDPAFFMPTGVEICEEPVLVEVLGRYEVIGWQDLCGEYDEESTFEVAAWTVAIDEEPVTYAYGGLVHEAVPV